MAYGKQDIHLYPSKPMFPGEAWRMNSYAGDQVKRYAANLPNTGINRFAGAFATSRSLASTAQAPGFTSALQSTSVNPSTTSFRTSGFMRVSGKGPDFMGKASFSSGLLNKPFKPPTRSAPSNLPTVSTVETRLTQQNNAVILNPVTPIEPQTPAYTLPQGNDEDFMFLKGLAKEESDDYAVRKPIKRSPKNTTASQPLKRSKS